MTEHLSLASTDGVKPGAPPARDIRLIAVDLDMTLVDWAVHGPHVDPKAIEAFTAADTRGVLCGIASPGSAVTGPNFFHSPPGDRECPRLCLSTARGAGPRALQGCVRGRAHVATRAAPTLRPPGARTPYWFRTLELRAIWSMLWSMADILSTAHPAPIDWTLP